MHKQTLRKAVQYVGIDFMEGLLVSESPVDTLYGWFNGSKYGMSHFSIGMLTALFPAMHFAPHLALRLENSRSYGYKVYCRYYMRPREIMQLPDYMRYVERELPEMHIRVRCGITVLRNMCTYYKMQDWEFKALLRLFLDYVYGAAPSADEIEITAESAIFRRADDVIHLHQEGQFIPEQYWPKKTTEE